MCGFRKGLTAQGSSRCSAIPSSWCSRAACTLELVTNTIIGYTGVAWFEFEGEPRLEWGYRLIPEARGRGYATEAGLALMAVADQTNTSVLLAMIDPTNLPSQNVIAKLGFTY
jgi:RimJ/RimL family protein N-acetyltransferase